MVDDTVATSGVNGSDRRNRKNGEIRTIVIFETPGEDRKPRLTGKEKEIVE